MGRFFHVLLERYGLRAQNTFVDTGDTWFNFNSTFSSRIDYIASARPFSENLIWTHADRVLGKTLQMADTSYNVDHVPVITEFWFKNVDYAPNNARIRWDTPKIVDSLMRGNDRQLFSRD